MTTFFLTDYFCRHFEKFVWQAFGLDRRADMVPFVFGNYRKLVYLAQTRDAALEQQARRIAERLGLAYEYRFQGYGDLGGFHGFARALRRDGRGPLKAGFGTLPHFRFRKYSDHAL